MQYKSSQYMDESKIIFFASTLIPLRSIARLGVMRQFICAIVLIVFNLATANISFAHEADRCIGLNHKKPFTYLINTCSEKVEVTFCYDNGHKLFGCQTKTGGGTSIRGGGEAILADYQGMAVVRWIACFSPKLPIKVDWLARNGECESSSVSRDYRSSVNQSGQNATLTSNGKVLRNSGGQTDLNFPSQTKPMRSESISESQVSAPAIQEYDSSQSIALAKTGDCNIDFYVDSEKYNSKILIAKLGGTISRAIDNSRKFLNNSQRECDRSEGSECMRNEKILSTLLQNLENCKINQ